MTALPDWDTFAPRNSDAELVRGSMAGDRTAFAQIYDRYADRLHDFCVGMLRDLDGAADCVQETFCIAATRLHQLREPDKLRPWLYSIARNEALRRLRERRRETPSEELPDVQSDDDSLDTLSARTELADLIAEVAGGLSDRDRAVLDLSLRHGMDGPDLAEALGVSHTNANTMVVRLRKTIERSLGALLVARGAQNDPAECAELRDILAGWDGQFTVLMRKRIARHIESCPTCDDSRRRLVSPAALLGAAPVFVPAPAWLRERTLSDVQLTSHGSAMAGQSADEAGAAPGVADPAAAGGAGGRRRMMVAALLIAELGAATGLLLSYINSSATSVTPAEVDDSVTAPTPTNPQPTASPAQLPPQAPVSPPPVPTPWSGQTPEGLPTILPPPPNTPAEVPSDEEASPPRTPPSVKPPMSFSPTVVVTPAPPPDSGGGNSGDRRPPRAGSTAQ